MKLVRATLQIDNEVLEEDIPAFMEGFIRWLAKLCGGALIIRQITKKNL